MSAFTSCSDGCGHKWRMVGSRSQCEKCHLCMVPASEYAELRAKVAELEAALRAAVTWKAHAFDAARVVTAERDRIAARVEELEAERDAMKVERDAAWVRVVQAECAARLEFMDRLDAERATSERLRAALRTHIEVTCDCVEWGVPPDGHLQHCASARAALQATGAPEGEKSPPRPGHGD